MTINWSIVAAAAGFAGARALMFEYQLWKARRTSIPLDWNPRTQAYEPDLRLKRWEKIGRIAMWGFIGVVAAVANLIIIGNY